MGIVIALIDIVQMLLWVLSLIIIAQAIFSWLVAFNVVNTNSNFVRAVWQALDRLTEPLYRPVRRIMPDFGGIDFSPLVVLLLIWVISRLLGGVEVVLARSYYMGACPPRSSTAKRRPQSFGSRLHRQARHSERKPGALLASPWSSSESIRRAPPMCVRR